MKIQVIETNSSMRLHGIKVGDIYEVIEKKEPDKFNNQVRYRIKYSNLTSISLPEQYVKEINS